MEQYISKSALVAWIEKERKEYAAAFSNMDFKTYEARLISKGKYRMLQDILSFLDTLEVKGPYEEVIQYDSVKSGIQAHAETYSFNIESILFNQLTKEQQKLWRKEIEQAVISGGEMGVELARDPRYKENVEVKEVEESVSKDFFIEKACNFIDERLNFDDNAWYIEGEVTVKDKVIEDFKNYIKGE